MEQAIVSIVGLILAVVLYQERTRRADAAALRRDMNAGFTVLRDEFKGEVAGVRDELRGEILGVRGEVVGVRDELRGEIVGVRDGFRGEIVAVRDELKADMSSGFARMDRRFDNLTAGLVALAESVGQVKGRTEVLTTAD